MSDQEAAATQAPVGVSAVEVSGGGVTAGGLLREARAAAGLHIAALAVSLKVPVRKLEALEGNQFDELPDAVFVRALAASVCRTLKIDAAPVLQLLPTTTAPRLTQDNGGLNAPFRPAGDVAGQSRLDQLSRPMVLAVLALLMGALVLIFLPSVKTGVKSAAPEGETAGAKSFAAPTTDTSAATSPVPLVSQSTTTPMPAATAAGNASVVTPPAQPGNTPAAAATPTPTVTSGSTGVALAPAASGVLVLKASAESWVEVTDAKDVVVLRRILGPGEAVGASGTLPLRVIVGRANVTSVQIRGKAFDLAPVSSDNVARFEVK